MSEWAIELTGLSKRFGELQANDGISLKVRRGSIHGIIGENGAGKSTAMKMLYGIYAPDSGEIRVKGEPHRWNSSADAIAAGIGMVHQHFMLAGPYTALENVLLLGSRTGFLKSFKRLPVSRVRAELQELSKKFGMDVPWDERVERLPVGVQQRIEILKLLHQKAEILILDEPTAVLTPQEIQELFKNLRNLREQGKTILIITHKLREVMELTDRVTVFRAGKVTGEIETKTTNPEELARLMVGRQVVLKVGDAQAERTPAKSDLVLELRDVTLRAASREGGPIHTTLDQVSFKVNAGEIVGIAGVEGNGQSELIQAILHPSDPTCRSSGQIWLGGEDVTRKRAAEIRRRGLSCVPEDRHKQGLLLEATLRDNFLLGLQRRSGFSRLGFVARRGLEKKTHDALVRYQVRPQRTGARAGQLSGGNQQKVIIAREFEPSPRCLIVAQPTRGVDVGAIEFIHQQILEARDRGMAILLISSELDEVLGLSDRVLVLYRGKIHAEFARGRVTEQEVGLKMGGA